MTEYIEKTAAATIPVMPKEHRKYQTLNLDDAYENGWYDALECVEKIPPADVKPVVHGHWERLEGDRRFMCSVCKWKENVPTIMGEPTVWDYCPSCGATMKGAQNG